MMQKSEAGKHQKQHMQKSWDARHWDRVKAFWKLWSVFCSSLFGGRILDHESWRTLQGLAHDWYCLMALVKVLGYIVDDGNVVGRNVKEAMNPRKLQSSEKHWKQRKKRIDCWSFARFVACGTVLSCFVNMFWAVSVDDFGMTPVQHICFISFFSFRVCLVDGLWLVYGQRHWVALRFLLSGPPPPWWNVLALRIFFMILEKLHNLEEWGRIIGIHTNSLF